MRNVKLERLLPPKSFSKHPPVATSEKQDQKGCMIVHFKQGAAVTTRSPIRSSQHLSALGLVSVILN